MVLVDSGVWIGLLRQRGSAHVTLLRSLLAAREAAVSVLIYQEVLQGAASPRHFQQLREYFSTLPVLHTDSPMGLHEAAAHLYARCRWSGVTPRNSHDCVIAQTAIELEVPLLASGRDFAVIARVEPHLRLFGQKGA